MNLVAVSILNESGLPIVVIPDESEMNLLSGVISAVLDISRRVSGEEIEFVKTQNRIIFLKHIGERGYLLLAFRNVKDPREVGWIVILFTNELERYLETTYDFVDDVLISAVTEVYNKLTNEIQIIFSQFMKIREYHQILRKIVGAEADALIKWCSDKLILIEGKKVRINHAKIKNENLRTNEVKKIISKCEHTLKNNIKKFL